jgi:streptogramin lyase
MSGNINYSDNVAKGKAAATKTKYVWTAAKSGFTTATLTYSTPISYRCDQALGSVAGCVFPSYTPFLTSLSSLPNVAANITTAQGGSGHYGVPGSKHPLHRITSTAQQNANHNAVCAASVVGSPPAGQSCDEYPFKSAKEGGKTLSAANRHTAWVPSSEHGSALSKINAFYNANRVLNGDAFWVIA